MTLMTDFETDEEIVVGRLVSIRDDILETIAPDGRPYGMTKLTERERLRQYVENLKGNPQAWRQWMGDRVLEIQQALADLPPEKIAMVAPWNIAQQMALAYSAGMERALRKEEERINDES